MTEFEPHDIRPRHEEIRNQDGIDFENLKWYAVGAQVRDSLLGKTPENYEYVITEADKEELLERGFTHTEGQHFADSLGNVFVLAEGDNSLEAYLRQRPFTINSIAMKPGEQDYHFPLMNNFEEDDDRPEQPINPVKDLDEKIIRHTTNDAFKQLEDKEERIEEMKEKFPEFEVADETKEIRQSDTE